MEILPQAVDEQPFSDLDPQAQHEDEPRVNAIRNGHLVEVCWRELSPDEQRAVYVNLFHLYDI